MSCENPKKYHFIKDLVPVIPRSCPKQPNIHPDLRPKLPRCQLGFYIKSPLDPIQCCCLLRLTHFASYTSCSTYTQFNIKYSVNRKNTDKHDNLFAFSYTVHSYKVVFIQKGLMRLSFLQTDKPNYFPELDFLFILNCSNHVK